MQKYEVTYNLAGEEIYNDWDSEETKVVKLLAEKRKISDKYQYLSSVVYEKEYQMMKDLQDEAMNIIKQLAKHYKNLREENLYQAFECAADEIVNNEHHHDIDDLIEEVYLYDIAEFTEHFIFEGEQYTEREQTIFNSFFERLTLEEKAIHLESLSISDNEHLYTCKAGNCFVYLDYR